MDRSPHDRRPPGADNLIIPLTLAGTVTDARQAAIEAGSVRFQETMERLERFVQAHFPDTAPVHQNDMPGWRIPIPEELRPARAGTFDPAHIVLLVVERKQGITVHLWNPLDYTFLEKHAEGLKGHGFKVMRGCLQYNRKGDVPVDAVGGLLADVKRSIT